MSRRDAAMDRRFRKIDEMYTCDCGGHRINIGGAPTCMPCGLQGPFTVPVPEMDLMSWRKKKSVHKRSGLQGEYQVLSTIPMRRC